MVIQPTDRVSDVLARNEALVEVFAAAAAPFERLRNPALRKVMARLVTVEQAARVAGIDPEQLLRTLNEAAGSDPGPAAPESAVAPAADAAPPASSGLPVLPGSSPAAEPPAALLAVSPQAIIDLDVREDLRNGNEPFSRIMAARRELAPDGALRLRAIFEPVPLYSVLGKQGLSHWTDRLADDDWIVWFYPSALDAAAVGGDAATQGSAADERPVGPQGAGSAAEPLVLDVRGLEPPEPMQRTLEALATLPPGGTLIQLNVRVPQMLLPQLEARGYTWVIHEEADDRVRVVIHAPADAGQP
jgi:TusA-related sulfurtransferase